jgi:hypothetical protein
MRNMFCLIALIKRLRFFWVGGSAILSTIRFNEINSFIIKIPNFKAFWARCLGFDVGRLYSGPQHGPKGSINVGVLHPGIESL